MDVRAISSAASADRLERQAMKAGVQFEAILLNTLFGDLQRAFSQLPGAKQNAVDRSYSGMAMEALTSGLAKSGGIGLGRFLARALITRVRHSTPGT